MLPYECRSNDRVCPDEIPDVSWMPKVAASAKSSTPVATPVTKTPPAVMASPASLDSNRADRQVTGRGRPA